MRERQAMSTTGSGVRYRLLRARRGDKDALGELLEERRQRLCVLAERQIRGKISVRVCASDVVQQVFLQAHRNFGRFQGENGPAWFTWLRQILRHTLAATIRDHGVLQKRDVRRERSLEDFSPSSTQLRVGLAAASSTPSQRAIRHEDIELLTEALATLPIDQQEAVRLRHLEAWSLARIAGHLGRTQAATAGLIKRGMRALRQSMRCSV